MSDGTVASLVLSVASLLLYVAVTTQLAIAMSADRHVPGAARRFFGIGTRQRRQGPLRWIAVAGGVAIAFATQVIPVSVAFGQGEPLDVVARGATLAELALAYVWTVRLLVAPAASNGDDSPQST